MWIKDFTSEKDNPRREAPFVVISHLCYSDILPAWEYPWHAHQEEYEITFVMKGAGKLVVNEKETPVSYGDIYIMPPGTYHRNIAIDEKGMEYFVIRFRKDEGDLGLQRFLDRTGPAVTQSGSHFDYFESACRLLLDLHVSNGGYADEKVQTICLGMIQVVKLLIENRALAIRTRSDFSMNDLLVYITEHCEEKITLESLSKRFSVSASHLSRMFNQAFHCSPINYLINARMARATEYLGRTDKSISEIAELVGYENHFYFTNLFIKRIGCSPTEYRERLTSKDLPKNDSEIKWHR
ncbi:MAG: AraC family transcriptional regulator [Lachnospiraceae bacterium]|nr:AraC family transcriptional regulator [Lachnospiraceae bacterium]